MSTPGNVSGSRTLTATFFDDTTAPIKVRQLPMRLLANLDAKQADESALVELYCEQEEGWADKLTHESFLELLKVGDEINLPAFKDYTARNVERLTGIKGTFNTYKDAGLLPDEATTPAAGSVSISAAPIATAAPPKTAATPPAAMP